MVGPEPEPEPEPFRIVAHRGDSHGEPEHTLAAYRRAIEQGADAVECDVRLTADGHLVCLHDRIIDRTSDGHGVVSTTELSALRELDFGSWKNVGWPGGGSGRDRTEVLTLRRLLALVADAERPVRIAIETKHPNRYSGLVERRLVETLDEFGWARPAPGRGTPVQVMSFSLLALRRMRQLMPRVPQVMLLERVPPPFRAGVLPPGVSVAGIGIEVLRSRPEYVARVRERGGQVCVWTVDAEEDVQRCCAAGVRGIITNRPGFIRAVAAEKYGGPPGKKCRQK